MAFGWLGDAVGLAGSALGIINNFKDPKQPAVTADMQRSAQLQRQITEALMQPDLGRYSGLVDAEQETINRDTSRSLQDLMLADRRSRATSASGLGVLSSDRRDESLARAMQQSRDQSREAARARARNYLTQALTGAQVQMGGFAQIATGQSLANLQGYERQNRAFEQMTYVPEMLGQIFGSGQRMLNGGQTASTSYSRPMSSTQFAGRMPS